MTTEYSYDNANRVTSIVTKLNGNVLRSYSYTYDGNGNVLTVSGSENAAYTYDSLNRLASSTKNGVTTTYSYDVRNNLISETDGTNTKTYEYGGDNRLHKVVENGIETIYEYDLNGNLVQRGEDIFAYDEKNRLVYSNVDGVETTYVIGIEGLRKSKTTGDETRNYSYNENGYVLVENEEPVVYGHTALAKKSGTSYYYYLYNAHGDVTAIVDETGNILNSYEYTPWGEISSQTETVENDIKYAGEYYDEETGLIYLRNRYYDPSVRRFISEDPARDDLNWYCYCGNNPVNFVDPLGLFDYDDRLSPSTKYNIDVKVMQNELAWLGYYSGEIDGYFGQKTLDAVNAYKNAMGLGNTGSDWGVVGKQTWESMGLIYRTQADIDIGVKISTDGLKQYKDFSLPINNALKKTVSVAEGKCRFNYKWFISQVNHEAPWDIKREKSWNKTIGNNTYPGWGVEVKYNGNLMTPEELGNYTYGYIGAAMGLTNVELYGGSWYAAGFPISGAEWTNEYNDWSSIKKGAQAYRK